MTTGLPNHIKTILAWVVSIAITVLLLLALSPRTVAQAHETGSRAKTQNSHAKPSQVLDVRPGRRDFAR